MKPEDVHLIRRVEGVKLSGVQRGDSVDVRQHASVPVEEHEGACTALAVEGKARRESYTFRRRRSE